MGAELPAAVLLVSGSGVCRAPPPHHRPLLLAPGEAQTQLPGAATYLPLRRSLQVRRVAFSGQSGVIVTCCFFFLADLMQLISVIIVEQEEELISEISCWSV